MKMNYGHHYTPISQIAKKVILASLFSIVLLFSAVLDIKESKSSFTYHWSLEKQEIESFIKDGLISAENVTSIYFEGRYYPYYSFILENDRSDIVYRVSNKKNQKFLISALKQNVSGVPEKAKDIIHPTVFNDHIQLEEVPGVGTLVEIIPFIPDGNGNIQCLSEADFELYASGLNSLKRSNLKKEKALLAKSTVLAQELSSEYCVLYVQESGVYQISGKDLLDKGVDISTIIPDQIKLHRWGEEIPCAVTSSNVKGNERFETDDVIKFYIDELINPYGNYKYNPFTDFDVVIMTWDEGNGKRYVQETSVFSDDPNKFTYEMNRKFRSTIHIEENQRDQPLARLHEDELSHLYEHSFYYPSIKVGRTISYPFEIYNPVKDSPYSVEYKVRMQGLTYSVDDEMDHQIIVKVNNVEAFDDEWEGQQPRISDNEGLQYSHANLLEGENELEISVRGFGSGSFLDDQVLLDWFEISYDRYMIAHDNRLKFTPQHGPGTYMFQVKGFNSPNDILILKNGTNWIRGYLVVEEEGIVGEKSYTVYFEDKCKGDEEYMVAGPGKEEDYNFGIAVLDSFRYVNTVEDERYNSTPQGDYVIITHKDFYEKAKDLAIHKQGMGFTPALYELERIYDEYNYGNESPYAIKKFLQNASSKWSHRPDYLILIGDTGTENAVPVIHYQSTGAIGSIIAENWYADLDDDFVLDLSLGRLPVSEVDELDSIIIKIINYDNISSNPTQYREGMLSGPGSVFRSQVHSYVNGIIPDYFQTDRLYLYDTQYSGDFDAGIHSTDTLVNFINDGVLALNYLGHGGGYTWDNHVLPYEAFEQFKPNRPFIVNSFTCFSNTFSNNNAIGEQFIRHPRASVSVLASTGYGWINSNHFLFEKVMGYMHHGKMSHGLAFRHALADYFFSSYGRNASFIDEIDGISYIKYFRRSLFYQFCFLGDPSVAYPKITPIETTLNSHSLQAGDPINVNTMNNSITHAQIDLVGTKGYDRKFPLIKKQKLNVQSGSTQLTMPDIVNDMPGGIVQMTFWDDDKNIYTSSKSVTFGSTFVESLDYYPGQPAVNDSAVSIRLNLDINSTIDSVKVRIYRERSLKAYSLLIDMQEIAPGVYQSLDRFIYSDKSHFYTAQNDTTQPVYNYQGNYFMPVIYSNGSSTASQFFDLFPVNEPTGDIALVQYSLENGKSKVVLLNQLDTTAYVKLDIISKSLGHILGDTVLSYDDVDSYYQAGAEKINTFYFDCLPGFGNDSVFVSITPINSANTNIDNDTLADEISNSYLLFKNGDWQNVNSDTCTLQLQEFETLVLDPTFSGTFSVDIRIDTAEHSLVDFGAEHKAGQCLIINSEDEISFYATYSENELNEDEFVAYYDQGNGRFYKVTQNTFGSQRVFKINEPGIYLIATAVDVEAPELEISINAREILERAYVSERSDFSIILTDNYGVNPLNDFRQILLDGEEISEENVSVVESEHIDELSINFKLEMEPGDHTLQVKAQDLVGNEVSSDVYELEYTGESRLINYGNFPNPFSTRTAFIYELTEQFDDLEIKIYTMSGRKIYTMSASENTTTDLPPYSIGYHEVEWRGKDEFGNTVANGVYFYVIEGQVDGKKIKVKGKLAKLWL